MVSIANNKDGTPYDYGLRIPAFDSASTDYRNQHRRAILGDADALSAGELVFIQGRCRHLIRNNPTASAARDKYVTSLGVIQVKFKNQKGETHHVMQKLWDEFIENPSLDGKGDLGSMQATWNGDRFESGEAISRMVIVKDGNKIPLKLQNIESEYLDASYFGLQNEVENIGLTRYGITFDKATKTKPEFYNFFKERSLVHYLMQIVWLYGYKYQQKIYSIVLREKEVINGEVYLY